MILENRDPNNGGNSSLSPVEQAIYQLIRTEYLPYSHDLDPQVLFHFCKIHFIPKYPLKQLQAIIDHLLEQRYFIKDSKLGRDEILKNLQRKRLFEFIQTHPGCYNRLIRRSLQIGSNIYTWHMYILENFGFIKKVHFHHSYAFFENRSYQDYEYDFFLLQHPKIKAIFDILQGEQKTITTITKELCMHYSTVRKYLQILTERSLIIPDLNPKQRKYHINSIIEKELLLICNGRICV